MFKLFCLCVGILAITGVTAAQEKAAWTAVPGSIYQQNKAYPRSTTVRLFVNSCYDKSGNVVKPLKQSDEYTVTVTGVGVSASTPTVGDCSLSTTLSIDDGTQPGIQMVMVKEGTDDVGFAPFAFMDATAGPTPAAPQVDVLWEVLTDHLCRDNFGNHMPGDLYCVEAKIGNNSGRSLQLAGVGFLRKSPLCKVGSADAQPCFPGGVATPNVSYQTARASAQAGQSTTTRNLIVNGTQAAGLLMASFTPFFLNTSHKSRFAVASAIVGTSLAQAINLVAPDQTIKEINNLDDQAFRDGKLIPNNTQVRILVFIQKKSLAEAIGDVVPQIMNANEISCSAPKPDGYKTEPTKAGYCYPAWEQGLTKCIKKLSCDPFVVKLALGKMVIVGDQIDYIQRVVVDSSVTSQEVPVPGAAPAIKALSFNPSHGPVGTVVTVSGSGFGTAQGTVKFGTTSATVISDWTDSGFKVTVPVGAQTGHIVAAFGGTDHDLGSFAIP